MKSRIPPLIAIFLATVVAGCNQTKDPDPTPPPPGTTMPRPIVKISPWKRPGTGEPIVLGIAIEGKLSNSFIGGTPPSQSRVVVEGKDAAGTLESKTIDVNPTAWSDGSYEIKLDDAAALIAKSVTLSFQIVINCTSEDGETFSITDTEP